MNGNELEIIIGLEVHIQLTNLKTKLFCACDSNYRNTPPNSHTCPICLGLPGSLPVINKKAIEFATRLALALNCKINQSSYFFRKNYSGATGKHSSSHSSVKIPSCGGLSFHTPG